MRSTRLRTIDPTPGIPTPNRGERADPRSTCRGGRCFATGQCYPLPVRTGLSFCRVYSSSGTQGGGGEEAIQRLRSWARTTSLLSLPVASADSSPRPSR